MKGWSTFTSPVICPVCGKSTFDIVEWTRVCGCIIEYDFCCLGCEDRKK